MLSIRVCIRVPGGFISTGLSINQSINQSINACELLRTVSASYFISGALYVHNCSVVINGSTTFDHGTAGEDGGKGSHSSGQDTSYDRWRVLIYR